MASNSGWTRGLPSGQSKVSTTDEEFRSLKSFVEEWIETEHYATGGSASSAGVHRIGSARIYQGTTSQLSNPTGDGSHRLMHTTNDGGLWVSNPSTSSWTLLTNSITLGSDHSWTGDNQFGNGTNGELSIHPPDGDWKILGIVSGATTWAAASGLAGGGSNVFTLVNPGSRLTTGDPIIVGSSESNTGADDQWGYVARVDRSTASIEIRVDNLGGSRNTINAGAVVRFIGFKSS